MGPEPEWLKRVRPWERGWRPPDRLPFPDSQRLDFPNSKEVALYRAAQKGLLARMSVDELDSYGSWGSVPLSALLTVRTGGGGASMPVTS